jgi:clorobiocin/coumermycin A biosynthesis protein CloN6/CouN6
VVTRQPAAIGEQVKTNRLSSLECKKEVTDQTIKSDLILLHAPSVFDFRERDDLLFAYLSDSDSVNVTTIYEMYPLGFFSIRQYLRERGKKVEIVNLAALMLSHPEIDVDKLLSRLHAPVFGIDLHWMCHCHGAIEVAKRLKTVHPDCLVILGGISSTYYAQELITYPCIDAVVKGYDTLLPVDALVSEVVAGGRDFHEIPNLVYKNRVGEICTTEFSHKPMRAYNDVPTDWSWYSNVEGAPKSSRMIMTLPNTGCAHDCPWCGGSRYAYQNIMGVQKTLITKDKLHIYEELRSLGEAAKQTSIYALQCYSETSSRMYEFLNAVREFKYNSVFFEQFHLPKSEMLQKMASATNAYIMLSPESHDPEISRLSGRGTYTMEQMEEWIPRALDAGIRGVMVWFFIGMPRQTKESVRATAAYCEKLLRKYGENGVLPLLCPMVPFLDPGSRFFEEPERHGYKIFHRTAEQHRQAMVEPLWANRLNYETDWLTRRDIQDVTYESIDRLIQTKSELGIMPKAICEKLRELIRWTLSLLGEMEQSIKLDGKLATGLRPEIQAYNRKILAYSSDQIIPMERPFGGRWFDDFTVSPEIIASVLQSAVR